MFVSKAGEAFNANPIFVFDKTVEAAIQVAKEQHDAYEMSQGRKEDGEAILPEGWVEVHSHIRPGLIRYMDINSGKTSYTRPTEASLQKQKDREYERE